MVRFRFGFNPVGFCFWVCFCFCFKLLWRWGVRLERCAGHLGACPLRPLRPDGHVHRPESTSSNEEFETLTRQRQRGRSAPNSGSAPSDCRQGLAPAPSTSALGFALACRLLSAQ